MADQSHQSHAGWRGRRGAGGGMSPETIWCITENIDYITPESVLNPYFPDKYVVFVRKYGLPQNICLIIIFPSKIRTCQSILVSEVAYPIRISWILTKVAGVCQKNKEKNIMPSKSADMITASHINTLILIIRLNKLVIDHQLL